MIEFNYKIVRDEVDEKKTYTPSIPTKLQDLVCVEGPNSSGKSTLLHILALGLFGLKNKNINDSLQRKLNDLSGSAHQDLTFSFSIKNDRNNLQIHSEKKNPHIQELAVYEIKDGIRSLLTAESFERKYNLIYDIPDDPLERLDELTKELRDRQASIGRSVGELKIRIRDVITEVQNSRDPKKLADFKLEVEKITKSIGDLEIEKSRVESERLLLNQYYTSKHFLEYQTELTEAVSKLEGLERARIIREKKGKTIRKKREKIAGQANKLFTSIQIEFQELYASLKKMKIKTKDDYIGVWKTQDLRSLFLEPERHYILFRGISAFRSKLKEEDKSIESNGKLEEANLLSELINLLSHYSRVKGTLPGIDKTIPQFITALEKRFKEYEEVKALHERYLEILHKLDNLEAHSRTLIQENLAEFKSIREEMEDYEEDELDDAGTEADRLKGTIERAKKRIEYFRDEMIRSGIKEDEAESKVAEIESRRDFRLYSTYREQEMETKLSDLRDEIEHIGQRIKEEEYTKTRHEHEIHRLEQQKPHKYQQRLQDLQKIFGQVQILEQRLLKDYDENLKRLMGKKIRRPELNKSQQEFFDAVAIYLGHRVGSIRHVNKEYRVQKIDLVDRKIFTQSGKLIMLTDLGTGQSQSAFLTGLLSSNDNRKIIALIDEVAMMDNESMKPIYEILRNKYADGSLLVGIVVQKGEALMVKPIP